MNPIVSKHHVMLEAEETWTEPRPKASSGPIVCRGPGTASQPESGTRLAQQISFNVCSCVQLLDGGVARQ